MTTRKVNPEHFLAGPGGEEHDSDAFKAQTLRAELVQVVSECCLEHSVRVAERILKDYKVTPKRRRWYP